MPASTEGQGCREGPARFTGVRQLCRGQSPARPQPVTGGCCPCQLTQEYGNEPSPRRAGGREDGIRGVIKKTGPSSRELLGQLTCPGGEAGVGQRGQSSLVGRTRRWRKSPPQRTFSPAWRRDAHTVCPYLRSVGYVLTRCVSKSTCVKDCSQLGREPLTLPRKNGSLGAGEAGVGVGCCEGCRPGTSHFLTTTFKNGRVCSKQHVACPHKYCTVTDGP